jgi:hypothetical protein
MTSSSLGILGPGIAIHICQICNKKGHVAADCYQRHNSSTSSTSSVQCQICWKFGHSAIQCYHRGNFSYQGRPPSPNLSAMHANFPSSDSTAQFWVADTGATTYMTSDLTQLNSPTPFSGSDTIATADGSGLSISNVGSSILNVPQCSLQLPQVLHVPKLSQHLLSVRRLCKDNNCRFICDAFGFCIQDKLTGRVLLQGLCKDGLYPIPLSIPHSRLSQSFSFLQNQFCYLGHQVNTSLWHKRFGHPSNKITSALLHQAKIPFTADHSKSICTACLERKFTKLPFSYPALKSATPLEVIHSDVWGPSPTVSIDGFRYYVSFIDACTRFTWIFPMRNKGEVYSIFVSFHAFLITQFSANLRIFQSDGGGEYLNHFFKQYLLTKGIVHHISCPYTPEQNGLAERKHRHILETAITLLQTAHLPSKFWFHACATSIYLINRLPCPILQLKYSYQLLYGSLPILTHLKVFGCAYFPLLKPYNTHKLQPKTSTCIFLGYAGQYKGHVCCSLQTRKCFVTRHVIFDESVFPYISESSASASTPSLSSLPVPPSISLHNEVLPESSISSSTMSPAVSLDTLSSPIISSPLSGLDSATQFSPLADPDFHPENFCVSLPLSPMNIHPVVTHFWVPTKYI